MHRGGRKNGVVSPKKRIEEVIKKIEKGERWKEIRKKLKQSERERIYNRVTATYGVKAWGNTQQYARYAPYAIRKVYKFMKARNLFEGFQEETRKALGEKYHIKFYCLTESESVSIEEAERVTAFTLGEDPWENMKKIVKRELRLQRYGLAYVPGKEIIAAYERARDIERLEERLETKMEKYYDTVVRDTVMAVVNAGVVEASVTVEDIVTGRRRVYTLEELGEHEDKTMKTIEKTIEYNREILELSTYSKATKKRKEVTYSWPGKTCSDRTGKKGKGGGIKNIKKAIAMTAIARI